MLQSFASSSADIEDHFQSTDGHTAIDHTKGNTTGTVDIRPGTGPDCYKVPDLPGKLFTTLLYPFLRQTAFGLSEPANSNAKSSELAIRKQKNKKGWDVKKKTKERKRDEIDDIFGF